MSRNSKLQGRSATKPIPILRFLQYYCFDYFPYIVLRLFIQMQEKLQNWSNAFAHAFQNRNFEEAKIAIRRMTYYSRVIDEVVKKL